MVSPHIRCLVVEPVDPGIKGKKEDQPGKILLIKIYLLYATDDNTADEANTFLKEIRFLPFS